MALGADISAVAFLVALLETNLGRARAALGPERAADASDEDSRLTLAEAVDEVLAAV